MSWHKLDMNNRIEIGSMCQLRPDRLRDQGCGLAMYCDNNLAHPKVLDGYTEGLHMTDNNTSPEAVAGVMLRLPTFDVQTSAMQPDGSYVVRIHAQIPPGVLKRQSTILTLNGSPNNALQGAILAPPVVEIPIRADRLVDDAVTEESPLPQINFNATTE